MKSKISLAMKITVKNIQDEYPKLDMDLPKGLQQEDFELVKQSMRWYNEDEEAKGYVDKFVEKLNLVISKASIEDDGPKPLRISDIPPVVRKVMPKFQQKAIVGSQEHWDTLEKLKNQIEGVPTLYQTEQEFNKIKKAYKKPVKFNDWAKVHLHFFYGSSDWFILEWDGDDLLYGYTILNGDAEMSELGYISLNEMHSTNKVELDFFWQQVTLQEALYDKEPNFFAKPQKVDEKESKAGGSTNKTGSQRKTTPPRKSRTTKLNTSTKQRTSTNKQEPKPVLVDGFTLEEKFIKRYKLLHNKEKTKEQILTFIKTLQKAILEKAIRKTSVYADDIKHIQKELIGLYNSGDNVFQITIDDKVLAKFDDILSKKKKRLSLTYIKRFVNFYGKQTKDAAQKLLVLIEKALKNGSIPKNDPHYKQIKKTEKALKEYVDTEEISITAPELRGLAGCVGLVAPKIKLNMPEPYKDTDLVPSTELKKRRFPRLGVKGKWKKVFGNLGTVFHIMIYGQGGKGKSTMTIDFAFYLCKEHGLRVLYVADEEKQGDTFNLKLEYLNAYHDDLVVVGALPKSLKGFDVVVLDSVTTIGITPDELKGVQDKNKGLSTIYINQTNKKGEFFGAKKWEHLCTTMIRYEDGELEVKKNRFGELGLHKLNYYKKRTSA